MDKELIVKAVNERMDLCYPKAKHHRICLIWAFETMVKLRQNGVDALIQAGTAMWPFKNKDQDDGISNTHFSYQFEDTAFNRRMMTRSQLPEMHVWVGIPASKEIVDLTTKFWPQQAKELEDIEWQGNKPPEYFWSNEFPPEVLYQPSKVATLFAINMLGLRLKK